ncbi:proline-rich protein 15 isoform X1 [Columba livia]|uniref:proline-rich protein 15 isoform X1 n=2 Tax=Columba livia TaxID=8932 RepID=UPI0031BAF365
MHADNTASTVGSPGFHYALGVLPYCSKAPSSSRPATAVCPFRGTPTSTGRSPTPHRRQVSGSRPGPGAGRAAAPPTGASRGAGCHLPPPHSARPLPASLFPPALLPSLFPSLPRRVEGGAAALPRGRRRALPPRAGERPQEPEMADSAAATAAPAAGVKGSAAATWWKSLTSKKKHKEAAAPPPPPAAANEVPAAPHSSGGREEQPPHSDSGEAAGGGNRRSLRISHSGRFKERRKVRTSLLADGPEVFDGGGAPARSAAGGE